MRCLALDVGDKRTGVAVGEMLARPLTTLKRRSKAQDFAAIAALIRQHGADTVVVGLPLNMDGTTGFQAQKVAGYAEKMKAAFAEMGLCVEVVLWDERLTSDYADGLMSEGGHDSFERRDRVDAAAAAVILQSYLDRDQSQAVTYITGI